MSDDDPAVALLRRVVREGQVRRTARMVGPLIELVEHGLVVLSYPGEGVYIEPTGKAHDLLDGPTTTRPQRRPPFTRRKRP